MIVSSDFGPFDEPAYKPTDDEIALMRGSSEEAQVRRNLIAPQEPNREAIQSHSPPNKTCGAK